MITDKTSEIPVLPATISECFTPLEPEDRQSHHARFILYSLIPYLVASIAGLNTVHYNAAIALTSRRDHTAFIYQTIKSTLFDRKDTISDTMTISNPVQTKRKSATISNDFGEQSRRATATEPHRNEHQKQGILATSKLHITVQYRSDLGIHNQEDFAFIGAQL